MRNKTCIFLLLYVLLFQVGFTQDIDDFQYNSTDNLPADKAVINDYQFNGYTNYWHDIYAQWYRYGNLFKISAPDINKTILQSKVDIAEDLGIPGLIMQEGFINALLSAPYAELDQPDLAALGSALSGENVLIFIDPSTETGRKVTANLRDADKWPEKLKSHQYGAPDLIRADAFYLENNGLKLFVVSSSDEHTRNQLKKLIRHTTEIIGEFDLHKGWFGVETLLKSVTCTDGHPLDVIGRGMNEGNSWFVFNGYMDFLAQDELKEWMEEVNLPVVTDVGHSTLLFGCRDYEGLQVQHMFTTEAWLDYANEKGGYVFRQVWDTLADHYEYDGYIATEGNKKQIDNEEVPFVVTTGKLDNNALSSMVLFIEKGKPLTREEMWRAIMDRREVGVLEQGKMLGPARYRNVLQLLLLDRVFLEDHFGDRLDLNVAVDGYNVQVTTTNASEVAVSGTLSLTLPEQMKLKGSPSISVNLPPGSSKTTHFTLQPTASGMDHANPIAVHYEWNGKKKSTVAMLDLPPAISVHRLLYAHAPKVHYPATIHNFTEKLSFPVKVEVLEAGNEKKVVYKTSQNCEASTATFRDMSFDLEVPPGAYKVKVSALGMEYTSQLGVGKAEGKPYAYTLDLNSDGVDEYRMENDSVQITLLATGARVIEYIVNSRKDNILFKLWPKKVIDEKRPFRERGFYPFGGFEDFLGQASMETHQVYDAEIVQKEGDYVRVRMWTDYFGNRLEKTFTLYGDSPLLEVRYALSFKNPEANVLGPQPILALGRRHWTEDVFTIPELDGLKEYRMRPEKRFGRIMYLKEGWNAGYDTKEDITFVGAWPVDQPLFLHMFMNEPGNKDSHYFYTEFQPWLPIFQKSTMYFTYYIWGAGGRWEHSVDELRNRNLISIN